MIYFVFELIFLTGLSEPPKGQKGRSHINCLVLCRILGTSTDFFCQIHEIHEIVKKKSLSRLLFYARKKSFAWSKEEQSKGTSDGWKHSVKSDTCPKFNCPPESFSRAIPCLQK